MINPYRLILTILFKYTKIYREVMAVILPESPNRRIFL